MTLASLVEGAGASSNRLRRPTLVRIAPAAFFIVGPAAERCKKVDREVFGASGVRLELVELLRAELVDVLDDEVRLPPEVPAKALSCIVTIAIPTIRKWCFFCISSTDLPLDVGV